MGGIHQSDSAALGWLLACIVYWHAWEIRWVPSHRAPGSPVSPISLLERLSHIAPNTGMLFDPYTRTESSSAKNGCS
jgi:hypothetical protein